jgi:hypothetical protein
LFLGACQSETELEQRRTVPQGQTTENGRTATVDATAAEADPTNKDTTYGTVDPNFSPDDPNTFSRKAGVAFPSVTFAVEGVPTGATDRYNYSFPVKADPSISHYAFKLDTSATCDKTGGYTVGDVKKTDRDQPGKNAYGSAVSLRDRLSFSNPAVAGSDQGPEL